MARTTQSPVPSEPFLPPLVGREREQTILRLALTAALAGHGALVLISGEAGIGKTALAEWTLTEAQGQGATILIGRCYDLSETPPYGPWCEPFARLPAGDPAPLPAPLGPGDAATDPTALAAAARDALAAAGALRPLVLLLDDVHWADPASLDLLRALSRALDSLPILLLATYRPDEVASEHPLYGTLPALVREGRARRLALRPLDLPAVAALVAARYPLPAADVDRLVAYLDRRAEGNPLFVGELLHALEESGLLRPPGAGEVLWALGDLEGTRLSSLVRQVIDGRAARLGAAAHELLTVAAAIGQEVRPPLWAAVAGMDETALLPAVEVALESRLLAAAGDGGRVRFAHALVREAFYEAISPLRRPALHRRIAEALAAASEVPDPDTVAYHFQAAGDPRAHDWLVRAAERARALYAPQSAVEHSTRALAVARAVGLAPAPALYRERGLAYEMLGEYGRAQDDQETALALARAVGDRRAEWQELLDLGALWAGRDYARTGDYYRQALDLVRTLDEPAALAQTLNAVGNWHVNAEEPRVGQEYQREALAIFRERGDQGGIAATIDQLGMTAFLRGDLMGAADHGRTAAALFRQLEDRQALASTLAWLCECGGWYGGEANVPGLRLAEARRYAEEAVGLARQLRWRAGEAFALLILGVSHGQGGDFGRALALVERGRGLAEEVAHGEWLTEAHFRLGGLYRDLLAPAPARWHLEQALALARGLNSPYLLRAVAGTLALACLDEGDRARARALLTPAALGPEAPPHTAGQRHCWLARAELALAENDPALALRIAECLVASDPHTGCGRVIPHLWRLRARALAALERREEALAAFLVARDAAADHGARSLLWRLHADIATVTRAVVRQEDAARALIAELADTLPTGELRDGFARGALALIQPADPGPHAPVAHPAGLTAREVEVLRLVAEGLTDAEVAGRLFLSTRTVSTHLRSIYTKLDVSTRTAAARLAADHGLT